MNSRDRGRREQPAPERSRAPQRAASSAGGSRPTASGHTPRRSAAPRTGQGKKPPRSHVGLIVLGVVAGLICCSVLVFSAVWNSLVKPPDLPDPNGGNSGKNPGQSSPGNTEPEENDPLDALPDLDIDEELPDYISDQKEGVYTFLILGRSDEDNYTDMIMLVVFDTNTGTVNAASIPRDTMVNLSVDIKRINSASGGGNVSRMKQWVRKTIGIQPNFYVMVDWQAVGDMVDAVGGVDYNVPFRMHYVDPTPEVGFTIDLQEGWQHLNGEQAMQVIRWRKNNVGGTYAPGDSARMKLQQQFIREMAYQFLKPKNITKIGAFATIFKENVDTDLSLGNLVWFAQKALEKDSINKLTFHSLPGDYSKMAYSRSIKTMQSYVTLYPNQLLTLINDNLNPYNRRISLGDLDLMSINADGTISSSTGALADVYHNKVVLNLEPVKAGLAHFDKNWDLVYETPEDDPNNQILDENGNPIEGGEPIDGEDPSGGDEPGGDQPSTGGTTDPSGDPSQTEGLVAPPVDPDPEPDPEPEPEPDQGEYDPDSDPNYNPDPWATEREENAA